MKIIVISGESGSGKTELSKRICAILTGFKYINVGDLLASSLMQPLMRDQIGPMFLSKFGIEGYCKRIVAAALSNSVFDGVRLVRGIEGLRAEGHNVFHIHRPGHEERLDPFARDTVRLAELANLCIPWLNPISKLDSTIEGEIVPRYNG